MKAEGYRTVLQTVEITSAYENAFSNEQVELVAGEDDATGNIELTLVDAATGDAIDYAVALEIREGANNVSGNILKEIAVERCLQTENVQLKSFRLAPIPFR